MVLAGLKATLTGTALQSKEGGHWRFSWTNDHCKLHEETFWFLTYYMSRYNHNHAGLFLYPFRNSTICAMALQTCMAYTAETSTTLITRNTPEKVRSISHQQVHPNWSRPSIHIAGSSTNDIYVTLKFVLRCAQLLRIVFGIVSRLVIHPFVCGVPQEQWGRRENAEWILSLGSSMQ